MPKTIGNPLSWTFSALGSAAGYATVVAAPAREQAPPVTRRLTMADLRAALAHAGVDTLELSTEGDLVDAVVRFADLRRQRTRRGTGGALPRHLHQAA